MHLNTIVLTIACRIMDLPDIVLDYIILQFKCVRVCV